ncbi:LysR family transcriptional regulator [Phenylobacterium sp.]|jgi:DNA-binding transcriptional LysR family regulator|uniref:LysR family transcriptional regulator n=1 Tax=Phenylobacterium sp. TaxID=1871053 RepID=UPI002F95F116
MDLNQTVAFVEVVRAGTFVGAARRLNLPKSTVSARIQALETELGAVLLRRSTRQVSLTVEGRAYFQAVADAVDTLKAAAAATANELGVLSGRIRLTAPLEFPHEILTTTVREFRSLHPKVQFDIILTNEVVDLVAQNVDVGLRFGEPGGAGLIVRKVGTSRFGFYASPAYLAVYGAPASPDDLARHAVLTFSSPEGSRSLTGMVSPGRQADAPASSNNMGLLRDLALADQGIVELPESVVASEVARGELVSLLEPWRGPPVNLNLVFPSRRDITPRVKAFADHLAELLRQDKPIQWTQYPAKSA